MKVKNLIEHLQKNYQLDDEIAYSLWSRGDVACLIAECRPEINFTDDELDMVLDHMNHYHSAELGMNWVLMDSCIDNILNERK